MIFGRKCWLEKVGVDELKQGIIDLDLKLDVLAMKLEEIGIEKEYLEAIRRGEPGSRYMEHQVGMIGIEYRDQLIQYKLLASRRNALSLVLLLKNNLEYVKNSNAWDKITKMDKESLIKALSSISREAESIDEVLEKIVNYSGEGS